MTPAAPHLFSPGDALGAWVDAGHVLALAPHGSHLLQAVPQATGAHRGLILARAGGCVKQGAALALMLPERKAL